MSRGCHLATITFTSDPWAPKSDQFVQFESKRIFVANLKKFPQWNVTEPHWPWPLTLKFDHQNLICSFLYPSRHFFRRNSLRRCVHKNQTDGQTRKHNASSHSFCWHREKLHYLWNVWQVRQHGHHQRQQLSGQHRSCEADQRCLFSVALYCLPALCMTVYTILIKHTHRYCT